MPGVPVDADGELDPQAILDRRDEVIHDLDDSGQLPVAAKNAASTSTAAPAASTASCGSASAGRC